MKFTKLNTLSILTTLLFISANAQQVSYEEYDLDNGLHVILHRDNSAPIVVTSVMYHVGSKDENPDKLKEYRRTYYLKRKERLKQQEANI